MADYTRDVIRELHSHGCYFRHGKGDHDIWYSPISSNTFVVDGKIKSRELANAVMKQAGLSKRF